MITAGIIGAAGYTGGELTRLLLNHPEVGSVFAVSRSNAGKKIAEVHADLFGDTDLTFSDSLDADTDVIFLCMGHGESEKWLKQNALPVKAKIIDLSQDFRSQKDGFVYGLPELQKGKISAASKITNPGCFATAIQLALLPAVKMNLIDAAINISAVTGSTGAGQSLSPTSHFTWREGNHSSYKALEHQHLPEIAMSLSAVNPGFSQEIHFIPQRGSFTRGIHAALWFRSDVSLHELKKVYEEYYSAHPFTHVSENLIDLKQVVNTNKCLIHLNKNENTVVITAVIDNLLKGASGQAVQNMNLIFGFEETSGLKLKPSAY